MSYSCHRHVQVSSLCAVLEGQAQTGRGGELQAVTDRVAWCKSSLCEVLDGQAETGTGG